MAEQKTNIMVIGATGNIGRPLVAQLLKHPHFNVSALTRASSNSASSLPKSVTPVRTQSYTTANLIPAFKGQDIVISTIAIPSLGDQLAIVEAAVEAGVKRFVPAEFGFDTSTDECLEVAPCVFMKKNVIKYLRENEGKISWTGVFCGLWLDWSLTDDSWEWWSLPDRKMTIFDDGNTPLEFSTIDQAAQGIAASVLPQNLETTKNRFVWIHSNTVTPNQLLAYCKKYTQTADGDWRVKKVDILPLAADGQKAFNEAASGGEPVEVFTKSEKFMQAVNYMITSGLMGNRGLNQFGSKPKEWLDRFEMEEEDPESVVREVANKLKAQKNA